MSGEQPLEPLVEADEVRSLDLSVEHDWFSPVAGALVGRRLAPAALDGKSPSGQARVFACRPTGRFAGSRFGRRARPTAAAKRGNAEAGKPGKKHRPGRRLGDGRSGRDPAQTVSHAESGRIALRGEQVSKIDGLLPGAVCPEGQRRSIEERLGLRFGKRSRRELSRRRRQSRIRGCRSRRRWRCSTRGRSRALPPSSW